MNSTVCKENPRSLDYLKETIINFIRSVSHTEVTHVFASKLKWADVCLYDCGDHFDIHCKCKHCTFAVTTFILIHNVKKLWANSQECFILSREYNSTKFAYGRAFRHSNNIKWGDTTELTYVANWSIVAGSEFSHPLAWIVISRNLEWTELTVRS